jgi:hypothetical protein
MKLEEELTEMRLTPLGAIVYGALDAKETAYMSAPVDGCRFGIVFWGDSKPTRESWLRLIEYAKLAADVGEPDCNHGPGTGADIHGCTTPLALSNEIDRPILSEDPK